MMTDIEQEFERCKNALPELRARHEPHVAFWHFSNQALGSYWHKGDRKAAEASVFNRNEPHFACGYDVSGHPLIFREFKSTDAPVEPGGLIGEEFVTHNAGTVFVVSFSGGQLNFVSRQTIDRSLVMENEMVFRGLYGRTRFEYAGRRRVLQQDLSRSGSVRRETQYGAKGEQTFFRVDRNGVRHPLNGPLPKGTTVKGLQTIIRDRLVVEVPKLVSRARISEPIYAVALVYDGEGNDPWPPLISVGLERQRNQWISEHGRAAYDFIWNPAEFSLHERLELQLPEDDELNSAFDMLNGEFARGKSSAGSHKVLIEVARELNRATWPPEIQRTSDFMVYATDMEGGNLRRDLKASATAAQYAALREKNFV
ncbi:MAG TPA: hypothetical protein VM680_13050 [Verrucomicrobiae bacterium]|nr:hypothetical protein [Verrucomicrobiae bacterium]